MDSIPFTVVLNEEELHTMSSVLFTILLGSSTLINFSKRNSTVRTPMLESMVKTYLKRERERERVKFVSRDLFLYNITESGDITLCFFYLQSGLILALASLF